MILLRLKSKIHELQLSNIDILDLNCWWNRSCCFFLLHVFFFLKKKTGVSVWPDSFYFNFSVNFFSHLSSFSAFFTCLSHKNPSRSRFMPQFHKISTRPTNSGFNSGMCVFVWVICLRSMQETVDWSWIGRCSLRKVHWSEILFLKDEPEAMPGDIKKRSVYAVVDWLCLLHRKLKEKVMKSLVGSIFECVFWLFVYYGAQLV